MKNKTNKFLSALFCFLLISPQHAFAELSVFPDLQRVNPYYEAVNYLYEIGVINGYPDGTFKPDNTVSRVEFLKLALISSGIETNVYSPTGFPDIEESAWYAPYVRKAKNEGWIEGYPDGTFKPTQGVNKAEALKMIAKIQQWETDAAISESYFTDVSISDWYAPYTQYAYDKNLLDERGTYFIGEAHLSRGKVSEYLYRAFLTNLSGAERFSSSLAYEYPASENVIIKSVPPEDKKNIFIDFIPYDYKTTDKNFFDNLTLEEYFPNHFYLNEVYYFKGQIISGTYNQAFVFLLPQDSDISDDHITYLGKITGKEFEIPVVFRNSGNFKLGLILGNSGESKIVNVSVLPSLPTRVSSAAYAPPEPFGVTYANQNTTFTWENNGNQIVKLSFTQGASNKEYIFRQGKEYFNVDYPDFKNFTSNTVKYRLQGAKLANAAPLEISSEWVLSSEKSFTATGHVSVKNKEEISLNNFPETLSQIQNISFSGNTLTDIFDTAYIIRPDGKVDTATLTTSGTKSTFVGSATIPKGNDFRFSYAPDMKGTYILEINKTDGSAVLNAPVYIATGIPLIPDYFDLNNNVNTGVISYNLSSQRNEMLNLINKERLNMGLKAVTINSELNNLAQLHSEDMVNRSFFGHINPDGETPDDRRIKLGIQTEVNENLATAGSILYAHEGLMRSGIHRVNIIDPSWTKVGIGIAKTENSLYITQEFSTDPLTQNDLSIIEQEIKNEINDRRINFGVSALINNYSATYTAATWSEKMVNENFFDFTSPNGETLSGLISRYLPDKTVQAIIFESGNLEKIKNEILSSRQITDPSWREIGLGIKNDRLGTLKVTLLLTTH